MTDKFWIISGLLGQAGDIDWKVWAPVGLIGLIGLFVLFFFVKFGSLWLQARASGCPVSIGSFIGMFLSLIHI